MKFRNRYNKNAARSQREFSTGWLEDELDRLTSLIVRRREPFCFTCGIGTGLQCGHLFERRHRPTRWDIDSAGNNHSQCDRCNADHEAHPGIYRKAFIKRFGEQAYRELDERAHSRQKLTYSDLVALYEAHKATWETLKKAA